MGAHEMRRMVGILGSNECENPECGAGKGRKMVFCNDCYFRLDEDTQNALYSKDPVYFVEAVDEAIEILTI
jgi:hypothetical protein